MRPKNGTIVLLWAVLAVLSLVSGLRIACAATGYADTATASGSSTQQSGGQGGREGDPTYYVDPVSGSDANLGTSQAQAWQHIPGSYSNDNSGYLTATGWTTIKAGDVIKVKSGTTITNKLVVSSDWYAQGTSSAPITITVDTSSWGTGGPVIFDGANQTLANYDPMFFVWKRDYIVVDGVKAGGFVIQNSKSRGFQATGDSESTKMEGLVVRNMKLFNNVEFNVNVQCNDSFTFQNIEIDGNHQNGSLSSGFMIGDNTYGCSNGQVINCQSYNNGDVAGTSTGYTNTWIGFWLTNSTNVTYTGCTSHDNKGNGFDVGVVGSPASVLTDMIKYVNCDSYNNSNGYASHVGDIAGTIRYWYINSFARTNGIGFYIYNGATTSIYNCLTTGNTWGVYIDAPAYTNRQTVVDLRNTILYGNSRANANTTYPWDLWTQHTEGLALTSDYNDFEQLEPGGQITYNTCAAWDGADVYDVYFYDSTSAPGSTTRTWYKNHGQDAHSVCSVDNRYAEFVNPATPDYHLTSASSLIGQAVVINNSLIPEIYKDRDGNTRPTAGPWDIGPYQYVSPACTYSISPNGASFTAQAGTGSLSVTTQTGCTWTAASNDSWIRITSGASGGGSGTVKYSVTANTGASSRSGSITAAGQTFSVSQAGQPPKVSVSPASINFGQVGVGKSTSGLVRVANTGVGTLTVGPISIGGTNPGDFNWSSSCSTLTSAKSCNINMTFNPKQTGTRRATLSVSSNDPATPTVNVTLSGAGK